MDDSVTEFLWSRVEFNGDEINHWFIVDSSKIPYLQLLVLCLLLRLTWLTLWQGTGYDDDDGDDDYSDNGDDGDSGGDGDGGDGDVDGDGDDGFRLT